MITSLDDLRKVAVKHILRRGKADYLLRQSLCKRWIESTHLDEMAWTDFKSLFFNFPKLNAQLDAYCVQNINLTTGQPSQYVMDPGDRVTAMLAAACHEILHVLWLHKYRAKGKDEGVWREACEYAINYELGNLWGYDWIKHLDVMYPSTEIIRAVNARGLPFTTDGFYETLIELPPANRPPIPPHACKFCVRAKQDDDKEELDPKDKVRTLLQLPIDAAEREDIVKFLTAQETPAQKMPWEMLLMGGLEDAVSQEMTWARPSRRDDMLPSWRHEKLLTFVWVLDVSPSIDDEMKKSFMNTLQAGINLYHDAQHRVIFFADYIEADITVSSGTDLSRMEIPCGLGTDLEEVWAVLERDQPEYALVLTDLELSPVPKPSYTKVVWGIVGNYRMFDPDYGVKIELK